MLGVRLHTFCWNGFLGGQSTAFYTTWPSRDLPPDFKFISLKTLARTSFTQAYWCKWTCPFLLLKFIHVHSSADNTDMFHSHTIQKIAMTSLGLEDLANTISLLLLTTGPVSLPSTGPSLRSCWTQARRHPSCCLTPLPLNAHKVFCTMGSFLMAGWLSMRETLFQYGISRGHMASVSLLPALWQRKCYHCTIFKRKCM